MQVYVTEIEIGFDSFPMIGGGNRPVITAARVDVKIVAVSEADQEAVGRFISRTTGESHVIRHHQGIEVEMSLNLHAQEKAYIKEICTHVVNRVREAIHGNQ